MPHNGGNPGGPQEPPWGLPGTPQVTTPTARTPYTIYYDTAQLKLDMRFGGSLFDHVSKTCHINELLEASAGR